MNTVLVQIPPHEPRRLMGNPLFPTETHMATRLSRFQGSLMGVRIGDALGMPFEILNPEQIREITGPEGVTTFLAPQHARFEVPDWATHLGGLQVGDGTDDWQMTRAAARSLIANDGRLDLYSLAGHYLLEFELSGIGWGGTSRRGMQEMTQWLQTAGLDTPLGREPGTFARFPKDAEPGDGCGNGVAMRIAPHGLMAHRAYYSEGRLVPGVLDPFQQLVWNVGGLTHPDPRASIGAYAVASLIARLASREGEPLTREELIPFLSNLLQQVITMEINLGSTIHMPRGTEKFSARLAWVQTMLQAGVDTTQLATKFGTSSYTLESVPFSIAMALLHSTDFHAALKATVEAGGDTDTNAAMVGSIVGANVGLEGIPPEWRNFRPDFAEATELGLELFNLSEAIRLAASTKH